mgnify:CR=1 FL=1
MVARARIEIEAMRTVTIQLQNEDHTDVVQTWKLLRARIIKHTSGVVCVPMVGDDLDRLKLPPMTFVNEDRKGTAYSISVDARDGVSTGISAADRSRTARRISSAPLASRHTQ